MFGLCEKTESGSLALSSSGMRKAYYVASVPALPGCHTQARSLDKLIERIQEAIQLCLEVERALPAKTEFIGVQRVAV